MNNFIILILDGLGIGELPDSHLYNDEGSNTLVNMANAVGGLNLPNLEKLGLGNITHIPGMKNIRHASASFGKMNEASVGKDSTTGHWEMGGLLVSVEFPLYPNGFPQEIIEKFLSENNLKDILGNVAASGTEIINELGDEHVRTGFPIVYTSADSVFQIAAHEDVIPLSRLYEICRTTREKILVGRHALGRVIARPFTGSSGSYFRTTNRKDFSVDPAGDTILDVLSGAGIETTAVGKINDLFNHRGIKRAVYTKSNSEGIDKTIECTSSLKNNLIFINLVDFDVYFGHRNDPKGFYNALKEFDGRLPEILDTLDETDALIISADHGNDPTTPSTDHSREFVPLLFYRKKVRGKDLGVRESFSDSAQTAAQFFKVNNNLKGRSFLFE